MGKWHGTVYNCLNLFSTIVANYKMKIIILFIGQEKPFTSKKGVSGAANRYVTSQPLMRGVNFNLRKLEELPRHLLQAGMYLQFEKEVMFNLEWHFAKIRAFSLR